MKHIRVGILLMCIVAAVSIALAGESRQTKGEVEGFVLEIPDEFGKTQAVLEGSKALFDPSGVVRIEEVKARINQKEKEKGQIVVVSSYAFYHRDSKVVTTDQPVQVDSRDAHITGTGLVWEPEKQTIWIQEKTRVVLVGGKKNAFDSGIGKEK